MNWNTGQPKLRFRHRNDTVHQSRIRNCIWMHSDSNWTTLVFVITTIVLSVVVRENTVLSPTANAFTKTTVLLRTKWMCRHGQQQSIAPTRMKIITESQGQEHIELPSQLVSVYTKPASEHTQSWFGVPDPYLSAGKSIAPSTKALSDMGITITDKTNLLPSVGATGSSTVKDISSSTKYIIDSTFIQNHDVLPGFTPTGGILQHPSMIDIDAPPSVVSFVASIDWASNYINVIDKIPIVVLFYVCIEFFILRPNINLFKEDIDDDPMGTFVNTITVTSVRLIMFFVLTIVTVGVFG